MIKLRKKILINKINNIGEPIIKSDKSNNLFVIHSAKIGDYLHPNFVVN